MSMMLIKELINDDYCYSIKEIKLNEPGDLQWLNKSNATFQVELS